MRITKVLANVFLISFAIAEDLSQEEEIFRDYEENTEPPPPHVDDNPDFEKQRKQCFFKTSRNMTLGNVIIFCSNGKTTRTGQVGRIMEQRYKFKYFDVKGLLEEELKYNRVNVPFLIEELLKSTEDEAPGNLLNRIVYEILKARYETIIIDEFPRDMHDLWVVKTSLNIYMHVIIVVYLVTPYSDLQGHYLNSLPKHILMEENLEPVFDKFHLEHENYVRQLFPVVREYRDFEGFVLANGSYPVEEIAHDLTNYWRLEKICTGFRGKMMRMWSPKPRSILF